MDNPLSSSSSSSSRIRKHIVRERQWMYLGPIAAAPLAHIGVTLYKSPAVKKSRFLQTALISGIIGSTVLAISMRLVLMAHAGYPGGNIPPKVLQQRERIVTINVSEEEQTQLQQKYSGMALGNSSHHPRTTWKELIQGIARGFG